VILEDDESDTLDLEAAAVSALELGNPIDPSGHDLWYDVEDARYVDGDLRPFPPLNQEGLPSTLAQEQPHSRHHSPRSTQDQSDLHDKRITRSTSEDPVTHTPLESSNDGGDGWSTENTAELEKQVQPALEDQEKVSSPGASGSLLPRRNSAGLSRRQADQEFDQNVTSYGGLEELRRGTPLRSQDQGEEPQEQQQRQEVVEEAMREEEDDGDNEEREPRGEKRGEKRGRQDRNEEISRDSHHSEDSDCRHNTSDEDDEDPRPAKRRKL
jgi:hypothetical protein